MPSGTNYDETKEYVEVLKAQLVDMMQTTDPDDPKLVDLIAQSKSQLIHLNNLRDDARKSGDDIRIIEIDVLHSSLNESLVIAESLRRSADNDNGTQLKGISLKLPQSRIAQRPSRLKKGRETVRRRERSKALPLNSTVLAVHNDALKNDKTFGNKLSPSEQLNEMLKSPKPIRRKSPSPSRVDKRELDSVINFDDSASQVLEQHYKSADEKDKKGDTFSKVSGASRGSGRIVAVRKDEPPPLDDPFAASFKDDTFIFPVIGDTAEEKLSNSAFNFGNADWHKDNNYDDFFKSPAIKSQGSEVKVHTVKQTTTIEPNNTEIVPSSNVVVPSQPAKGGDKPDDSSGITSLIHQLDSNQAKPFEIAKVDSPPPVITQQTTTVKTEVIENNIPTTSSTQQQSLQPIYLTTVPNGNVGLPLEQHIETTHELRNERPPSNYQNQQITTVSQLPSPSYSDTMNRAALEPYQFHTRQDIQPKVSGDAPGQSDPVIVKISDIILSGLPVVSPNGVVSSYYIIASVPSNEVTIGVPYVNSINAMSGLVSPDKDGKYKWDGPLYLTATQNMIRSSACELKFFDCFTNLSDGVLNIPLQLLAGRNCVRSPFQGFCGDPYGAQRRPIVMSATLETVKELPSNVKGLDTAAPLPAPPAKSPDQILADGSLVYFPTHTTAANYPTVVKSETSPRFGTDSNYESYGYAFPMKQNGSPTMAGSNYAGVNAAAPPAQFTGNFPQSAPPAGSQFSQQHPAGLPSFSPQPLPPGQGYSVPQGDAFPQYNSAVLSPRSFDGYVPPKPGTSTLQFPSNSPYDMYGTTQKVTESSHVYASNPFNNTTTTTTNPNAVSSHEAPAQQAKSVTYTTTTPTYPQKVVYSTTPGHQHPSQQHPALPAPPLNTIQNKPNYNDNNGHLVLYEKNAVDRELSAKDKMLASLASEHDILMKDYQASVEQLKKEKRMNKYIKGELDFDKDSTRSYNTKKKEYDSYKEKTRNASFVYPPDDLIVKYRFDATDDDDWKRAPVVTMETFLKNTASELNLTTRRGFNGFNNYRRLLSSKEGLLFEDDAMKIFFTRKITDEKAFFRIGYLINTHSLDSLRVTPVKQYNFGSIELEPSILNRTIPQSGARFQQRGWLDASSAFEESPAIVISFLLSDGLLDSLYIRLPLPSMIFCSPAHLSATVFFHLWKSIDYSKAAVNAVCTVDPKFLGAHGYEMMARALRYDNAFALLDFLDVDERSITIAGRYPAVYDDDTQFVLARVECGMKGERYGFCRVEVRCLIPALRKSALFAILETMLDAHRMADWSSKFLEVLNN